jgi:pimeloyl-ACP methyl ester carboxylesterase
MNSNETLYNLSMLSLDEIEDKLQSGKDDLNLGQLLGEDKVAQLKATAARPSFALSGSAEMVVLLPGLMGSLLMSIRGVTDFLWINPLIFLNGHGDYLSVGNPDVEVTAFSTEKMTYLHLALDLRKQFRLFEFPYDWRMPIESNATLLHNSLARWSAAYPGQKFTLVGHSMGGLVIRNYLAYYPQEAESLINKAIYLGSPLLGATNVIENLGAGNPMVSTIDQLNPANHMRDAVLTMPGIYELMPVPPDLFPSGYTYPADWDLYDAQAWRVSGLRQDYLDAGLRYNRFLPGHTAQVEQVMIAGCNISSATVANRTIGPDGKLQWDFPKASQGKESGDGTVPLWSSTSDPVLKVYYTQCVHRDLPNKGEVIQAVEQLIQSGACALPTALPAPKPTSILSWLDIGTLKDRLLNGTAGKDEFSQLSFAL